MCLKAFDTKSISCTFRALNFPRTVEAFQESEAFGLYRFIASALNAEKPTCDGMSNLI